MRKAIAKIHTRNDGNLNLRSSGGDDKLLLNLKIELKVLINWIWNVRVMCQG